MTDAEWSGEASELAAHGRQGVIALSTLRRLGVPEHVVEERCRSGGPWRWLLPRVVLLSRAEPSTRQRVEAALLHGGHESVVTGFEAARLQGMGRAPDLGVVHLLVPPDVEVADAGFVVVERTKFLPSVVIRSGMRLAPPVRAVLDGLRRITEASAVRPLLVEAVRRKLGTLEDLNREVENAARRGQPLPPHVVLQVRTELLTVAEADTTAIWRRAGLPAAQRRVAVYDRAGKFLGMPDAWCGEVALAWELDSYEAHHGAAEHAELLRRNTRYATAGVVVVQTLPSRLRDDPDAVIAELRAAYEQARARPHPLAAVDHHQEVA
ncbi:hypothetical protein [Umezawaea beigongshangensis]|uniref:hypothetical protein n=1 Tax=Umezawaea beigongshangensis TaxID=2780383 RepID=UPI0018F117CB|nr:hypothetical protein [Umezawaea beigongshangensis]